MLSPKYDAKGYVNVDANINIFFKVICIVLTKVYCVVIQVVEVYEYTFKIS